MKEIETYCLFPETRLLGAAERSMNAYLRSVLYAATRGDRKLVTHLLGAYRSAYLIGGYRTVLKQAEITLHTLTGVWVSGYHEATTALGDYLDEWTDIPEAARWLEVAKSGKNT